MDFPPRPPREGSPEPTLTVRATRRRPPPAPREPARRPRRGRRETLARVGVSVPWIVFAILIVAVGGIPFALAMVGFALIGLSELFRMTRRDRPMILVAFATAAALIIAA